MAATNETTWVCDRCGATEVCAERGQPEQWGSVLLWSPPLMNPLETNRERKHLCDECCERFDYFMAKNPDNAPT